MLGGVIDKDYTGEIIVIMTSLIKNVESLKETERNNKGFGEMDKIGSIKKFSDEVFEYFNMYNYKI